MATLQPGNAPPWASMPLPRGWEAKYDQNVGRYFFINHSNRQTQWVDPRKAIYDAQQRSPAVPRAQQMIPMRPIIKPKCKTCQTREVESNGLTCQPCQIAQQQREISLMRAREQLEAEKQRQEHKVKLEKERERRRVQSAKRRAETPAPQPAPQQPQVSETNFNEGPVVDKQAVMAEMKRMFPTTDTSVVEMILETYGYNKDEAANALLQMGQRMVAPPKPRASPKASPSHAKTLTAAQKNQMKAKLKKDYPKATEMMLNLALDSTGYNEANSRALLLSIQDDSSASGPSRKAVTFPETAPTATSSSAASGSRSTTPTASLGGVRVSIVSDSPKRPQVTSTGSPAKKSATAGKILSMPGVSKKMPAAKKAAKKSPARSRPSGPQGAPYVSPSFSSDNMTGAKGPDRTLVKGPNRDNLMESYVTEAGPNPENTKGSDAMNVMGPFGGTGGDPSLSTGPNPDNRMGPEAGLSKGSMHQSIRQS